MHSIYILVYTFVDNLWFGWLILVKCEPKGLPDGPIVLKKVIFCQN